ncbi:MAG: lysophospholipid acyltransferase family protein [Acidimicrobiales bacterium]
MASTGPSRPTRSERIRRPVSPPIDTVSESRALVPVPKPPEGEEPIAGPRHGDVDEWGRSEHARDLARRIFDPVYRRWFRAEWEGLEKIPDGGGALLVANHAAALPSDAPVIIHGVETELGRPVYGLAEYVFRTLPFLGIGWARGGGVTAHPDNAYRLLKEQRQLVLVFPEGTKGTGKLYRDRYQLRRFGRGGFVEIAMRAGVPIVPVAVVGAEESMPILAKAPSAVAQRLGLPYLPLTANMIAFGPVLGAFAYFPAKFRLRVLDPVAFDDVEPDQPRYSRHRIMDEAEAIRTRIQEALYDMLRKRQSVWFG